MVMVDDATHRMRARFFEAETTRASYDVLESWVRQRGRPGSLSVDGSSGIIVGRDRAFRKRTGCESDSCGSCESHGRPI